MGDFMNREMLTALSNVYNRQPLRIEDGIPVFSDQDDYTANYERIAGDHLASLRETGTNPFIPEDLWIQTEDSTELLITKYARPGNAILDVGVGTGRLLSRFPELRRFGLDISFGYLEKARSQGIEVCYARIEDMPYRDNVFDVVVCTDVLEHVLDLNLCCRKILRVLKPDGVLVARAPFKEDLSWYASADCQYRYVHLRTFDEPSLRLLFEKALNCQVIESSRAGYIAHAPKLIPHASAAYCDYLLSRLAKTPEADRPAVYSALLRDCYDAIVINVVVAKSEVAANTIAASARGRLPCSDGNINVLEKYLRDELQTSFRLESEARASQAELSTVREQLALRQAEVTAIQAEVASIQATPVYWLVRLYRKDRLRLVLLLGTIAVILSGVVSGATLFILRLLFSH
jgi:SAM-dependent methyltransferase